MTRLPLLLGPGRLLTPNKARTLRALAHCGDRGSCSVYGVMDGAMLAALVQFELAERLPEDGLGGNRYRVTPAGLEVLARIAPLLEAVR